MLTKHKVQCQPEIYTVYMRSHFGPQCGVRKSTAEDVTHLNCCNIIRLQGVDIESLLFGRQSAASSCCSHHDQSVCLINIQMH